MKNEMKLLKNEIRIIRRGLQVSSDFFANVVVALVECVLELEHDHRTLKLHRYYLP